MIHPHEASNMEWAGLIAEIIRILRIDTYVEIGIDKGETFNQIAPLVKYAVGVDRKNKAAQLVDLPQVEFIHGSSPGVVAEWVKRGSKPIDFLFLDASHRKERVLADFDAWTPFVVPETGIIALHDTCPIFKNHYFHCRTAWMAAEEIRTSPKYKDNFEIMSIAGWCGISLVRKASQQLVTRFF